VDDRAVLLDCWNLLEKHGRKPTIKATMRLARAFGARFNEHDARIVLRPMLLPRGGPADTPPVVLAHPVEAPSQPVEKTKKRRVAVEAPPLNFGQDETIAGALLALVAKQNQDGKIDEGRLLGLRAELWRLREKHGRDAWAYGVGEALGHGKGSVPYASRCMTTEAARMAQEHSPTLFGAATATNGSSASLSLFTPTGRPTFAGEQEQQAALRFTRIGGATSPPKEP
jgi:hypothetical protein